MTYQDPSQDPHTSHSVVFSASIQLECAVKSRHSTKCHDRPENQNSNIYISNGLNLLHPRKDVADMVIVFCVSLIVPEDLMFVIKSGKHVYQKSSFFVSPLSFLRVS